MESNIITAIVNPDQYKYYVMDSGNKIQYYSDSIPNNIAQGDYYAYLNGITVTNTLEGNLIIETYSPAILTDSLLEEAQWQVLQQKAESILQLNDYQWNNTIRWDNYQQKAKQDRIDFYNALLLVMRRQSKDIPIQPIWNENDYTPKNKIS